MADQSNNPLTFSGSDTSHPACDDLPREDLGREDREYRMAFDRALRCLGQREHSLVELVTKLRGKGVNQATTSLAVDDLRGRGLQSDTRFAESFVRSRLGRGHGPVRIRQELSARGVDDEVADEAMDEAVLASGDDCSGDNSGDNSGGDKWTARAAAARSRKFGSEKPVDRDDWNRQARFLARRGFSSDQIYRVLGSASN